MNVKTDQNLFEALLLTGKLLGMNRSMATVFALLYSHEEAWTLDEIAETTKLSKSAISLALRELSQLGTVEDAMLIGERCRRYRGKSDLEDALCELIVERAKNPLARLRTCIDQASKSPARLEQVTSLLDRMDRVLAIIEYKS